MPATYIPQYLSDPPSLSFARQVAKPFTERVLREPEAGQGFAEPQLVLQTQQDYERVQELWRLLQEQQQSPPEPINQYGFPQPGTQSPWPALATGAHYSVNETNRPDISG